MPCTITPDVEITALTSGTNFPDASNTGSATTDIQVNIPESPALTFAHMQTAEPRLQDCSLFYALGTKIGPPQLEA